jgi:hypothetical protein
MKTIVYSLVLVSVIIVSSLAGYAEQNNTAEKQTDPGGAGFSIRF